MIFSDFWAIIVNELSVMLIFYYFVFNNIFSLLSINVLKYPFCLGFQHFTMFSIKADLGNIYKFFDLSDFTTSYPVHQLFSLAMLDWCRKTLNRYKKGLVTSGVVTSSVVAMGYACKRKLASWQQEHMELLLRNSHLEQHYLQHYHNMATTLNG